MRKASIAILIALLLSLALAATSSAHVTPGNACNTAGAPGIAAAFDAGGNVECPP